MSLDAAPQGRTDRTVRTPPLLCLPLALLGCFTVNGASSNAAPMVRVQAASDLDCPQSDIRVVQNFGGQVEAIGCGHKATYNTACDGLRCSVAPQGENLPWHARPEPAPTTP